MKDEELSWRATQVGNDDDETSLTDTYNDMIPGCYVLDIGIPGLDVSRLWIRADYIRIFDFFQSHYDKHAANRMDQAPSGVLTGQPGIGKSIWIYYATRRCAAEKKPFIWFFMADLFLFVDEGVYMLLLDWHHVDFRPYIWTFVDSDQHRDLEIVPPKLVPHGTVLYVLYVTSPVAQRWSRMDKTTRLDVVIMNPWSRDEIKRAAQLSLLENITEMHVNEIFDLFGPIPRLCVDSSSKDLEGYKKEVNEALLAMTVDQIEKLVINTAALSMDAVSHKICLISRSERDDVQSSVVTPITYSIQSRLSTHFRRLDQGELIRLYQYFSRVKESKVSGIFYEAIVQSYLVNGIHLELFPMVTLEGVKRKKSEDQWQRQWYSSHIPIHNEPLEQLRLNVSSVSVNIHPNKTVEYTDEGLAFIEPNAFYVSASTNEKALDSFVLLNGLLYIFQITVGMKHNINQGLIEVADKYQFPPREQWRFVLIIPPKTTLTVPRPWRLALRNLSPYSAVVSVDRAQV